MIPATITYFVTTTRDRDGRLDRTTYDARHDAWADAMSETSKIVAIHEITIWDKAKITARDITEDIALNDVWDAADEMARCDELVPGSMTTFITDITGKVWWMPHRYRSRSSMRKAV